jgi:hypothetical protein
MRNSGGFVPEWTFYLARPPGAGWKPAPEAAAGTLIRRVTFDLTGLPPSFAEVYVTMSHDP